MRNQSIVPAAFKVLRVESDRDPVFTVSPEGGTIDPRSEVNMVVYYTPTTSGTYSTDTYKIVTPGGNTETLHFSGRCVHPQVVISKKADPFAKAGGVPNSLNFRDSHVGDQVSRVLNLRNDSERPVDYCFLCDENGVFKINKPRGTIPAHFETSVLLSFSPQKPGNFYRRIFCLINDAPPQFIDCMGSGYISARGSVKEQRPAPLRHAHVQAFRNRAAAGLGRVGPAGLEEMYRSNKMSKLFAGVGPEGTQALAVPQADRPVTRSGEGTRNDLAAAKELFVDADDERGEVVLSSKVRGFFWGAGRRVPSDVGCLERHSRPRAFLSSL